MSTGETSGPEHPVPVTVGDKEHRYHFYTKHHGGDLRAARWSVSREVEFGVFSQAILNDLSDERGDFYGIGRDADNEILELGTWGQQVAEFPSARPREFWHGYPLWPVSDAGPEISQGQGHRPAKAVFDKMETRGIITVRQRNRLYKGKHA